MMSFIIFIAGFNLGVLALAIFQASKSRDR